MAPFATVSCVLIMILCVAGASGEPRYNLAQWQTHIGDRVAFIATYKDNFVVAVSVQGAVIALHPTSGVQLWKYQLNVSEPPVALLLCGETVFVATANSMATLNVFKGTVQAQVSSSSGFKQFHFYESEPDTIFGEATMSVYRIGVPSLKTTILLDALQPLKYVVLASRNPWRMIAAWGHNISAYDRSGTLVDCALLPFTSYDYGPQLLGDALYVSRTVGTTREIAEVPVTNLRRPRTLAPILSNGTTVITLFLMNNKSVPTLVVPMAAVWGILELQLCAISLVTGNVTDIHWVSEWSAGTPLNSITFLDDTLYFPHQSGSFQSYNYTNRHFANTKVGCGPLTKLIVHDRVIYGAVQGVSQWSGTAALFAASSEAQPLWTFGTNGNVTDLAWSDAKSVVEGEPRGFIVYGDDLGNIGATLPWGVLRGATNTISECMVANNQSPPEIGGGRYFFTWSTYMNCYDTNLQQKWSIYGPFIQYKPMFTNGRLLSMGQRGTFFSINPFTETYRTATLPQCNNLMDARFFPSGSDVFITCAGHFVYRFKADNTLEISKPTDGVVWDLAVTSSSVFFSDDHGSIYRLERSLFTQNYTSKPNYVVKTLHGLGWPVYMDGHVLYGGEDAVFYAVDADTGKTLYTHAVDGAASKPLLFNGTVCVTTAVGVWHAFQRDNKGNYVLKSSVQVDTSAPAANPGVPVVASDGTRIFSNVNGIFALTGTMKALWSQTAIGACTSEPHIHKDLVYVLCEGDLQTFDLHTGAVYLRTVNHAYELAFVDDTIFAKTPRRFGVLQIPPKAVHGNEENYSLS